MTDIPGNTTTKSTVSVGGTVSSSLEFVGDRDWFAITLTAGQQIVITLDATSTSLDTYLYLRDSAGNIITQNDDSGSGTNSRLVFTVAASGTYYIDVGAYSVYDGNTGTGTYQLSVQPYTPPPLYDYDQIGDQLVNGYWGGDWHRFDVTQGGSITVNLTGLTAEGQALARAALGLWSDVIGVSFVETAGTAQITFDDNDEGAYASATWVNNITTSAVINISTQWLTNYGTTINSYSFQTYVHEIGHALGLGHAGNYNGDASYTNDALFLNDAWSTTIMSYFSQTENTYFADQGFTGQLVLTPMMGDIAAMQALYGLSTTTRTGNTTYGFNSTASREVFNAAAHPGAAYTIFDSGGTDTLDYSGYWQDQRIDLRPESFSNVGGRVGNVSIARGTVIENAIGGSGNDGLLGNGANNHLSGLAGNDYINGREGADIMVGGLGNDTYYVDQAGDVVIERAGEGDDLVVALATYTLASGVHVETMAARPGTAPINLTGNEFAQSIYGNDGDNVLTGLGGADYLVGGAGNDRYYVDNFDLIAEAIGGGDDWVFVPGTYILREGVEIETLVALNQQSTDPVNLTGNEFGQSLYGSQGNNYLNGGAGNDYLVGLGGNDVLIGGAGVDGMRGGIGNDLYDVDDSRDEIFEAAGEGDDTIQTSVSFALGSGVHVETLVATGAGNISLTGNGLGQSIYGNSGANVLLGGFGVDYLVGNGGNDVLNAGSGNDWLRGGEGADRFAFDGIAGNDTILDFVSGTDRIDLSSYSISSQNVTATSRGSDTILFVDTNKDGTTDFLITLIGAGAPTEADYLF